MQAYEKAHSLGLVGTDAEIVEVLRTTGLTVRPINRAELIHLLNMRGMLRYSSDEKWTGTILSMQDAILQVGTDEQKNGIRLWFSHVTNPSNKLWDTTVLAFAGAFWQLYQTFADLPGMPSNEDFRAIASLGGGWLFSELTTEQYKAEREAIEAQAALSIIDQAYASVSNIFITPSLSISNRTKESIATALRLAADALEKS